jgi:hypothetical protein
MTPENKISLKELLDNEPRELYIEDLDLTIKVRDPTTEDKITARTEAKKLPLWNEMSDLEKATEISTRLALKMIVEPKITYEEYKKCPSPKIDTIIETVLLEWNKRVTMYTDKTRKAMRDFLEQRKGSSQRNFINT